MIITVDELNNFLNNYESSDSVKALKESVIASAEDVVIDYLGYCPLLKNYQEEYHNGTGKRTMFLNAKNVVSVNCITEDGEYLADVELREDCLYRKEKFNENKEYCVDYLAGWRIGQMPIIIKNTILRVASLMWLETGGNIGLSARTSPDNSKTFISYNNYSKYLAPLEKYRVVRF